MILKISEKLIFMYLSTYYLRMLDILNEKATLIVLELHKIIQLQQNELQEQNLSSSARYHFLMS
jgi:hypothetical protein